MIFSALESLAILLITLYVLWKAGIVRFIRTVLTTPSSSFVFFYSLVFAAIVGISTLNFGTLARYRIPVIPFYLSGILAVLYQARKANRKKPHESTE